MPRLWLPEAAHAPPPGRRGSASGGAGVGAGAGTGPARGPRARGGRCSTCRNRPAAPGACALLPTAWTVSSPPRQNGIAHYLPQGSLPLMRLEGGRHGDADAPPLSCVAPGSARAAAVGMVAPYSPAATPGPEGRPELVGPAEGADALFVVLGAGFTALSHPLLYVKLLVQVRWPGGGALQRAGVHQDVMFFYPARHIVKVDGKTGLFRGLTPRILSSTLSTVTRGSVKKAFPLEDMEHVSNKDDMKTSLRKVVKECSCKSTWLLCDYLFPFLGSGVFSSISRIFKEEGILGFFVGLVPHLLGDVVFLWCCNLLAHFINTYAVDDNFSQASVIRSYTKFVMGIAVSMLTYPFLLVGDLMAVNNCGLRAGLPPYSPVFTSWIHCWRHLSAQGQLFRGSSLLFRRVSAAASFPID
uniref:Mitochondrial carrier 1 n=1 Tax=Crocodylus porosus TaxID=8502 RepID=A0A7M4E530_CROPO